MSNANAAVAVNKMALCKPIFDQVFSAGYDLGGKTQRHNFIARAIAEVNCTQHGAASYYQNLSNAAKGESLYKYNKSKPKAKKADVKEMEAKVNEVVAEAKHRWMAVNETGVEVNSFKSRDEAQKFAKSNNLKWADRNKAA